MKFGPAPYDPDMEALKETPVIVRGRRGVIQNSYYDTDHDAVRCWVKLENGTAGWFFMSEIGLDE